MSGLSGFRSSKRVEKKTLLAKPLRGRHFLNPMSARFTPRAAVEFWASRHGVSVDQLVLSLIGVGSWDLRPVKSRAKTDGAEPSPQGRWPRFPLYNVVRAVTRLS